MKRETLLRRRIHGLTRLLIVGSGFRRVTATPLGTKLNWLVSWFGFEGHASATAGTKLGRRVLRIRGSLVGTQAAHPQSFYGTADTVFPGVAEKKFFLKHWLDCSDADRKETPRPVRRED